MFGAGTKLEALQKRKSKAINVFLKAKDDLVNVNTEITTEVDFAKEEITHKEEEIKSKRTEITDFEREHSQNAKTIVKIGELFK